MSNKTKRKQTEEFYIKFGRKSNLEDENTENSKSSEENKKEHVNEFSSGLPPSKQENKSKPFPIRLIIILALLVVILLLVLTCLLINPESFGNFIDFMNNLLGFSNKELLIVYAVQ